jgi:hypothetical protein
VRPAELRRQIIQFRSIQGSIAAKTSPVPGSISTASNDEVGGEKFQGTTNKQKGLKSQESTLDAHYRIIEE